MGHPWTIARRIAVGFAVLLALAVAIATSTTLALRSLLACSDARVTEFQVMHLVEVERLRRAFSEKLAAQRGHALTGDASFQVEAELARRQFSDTLEGLRSHAEPGEEARTLEALARTEALHEQAAERQVESRLMGGAPEVSDVGVPRVAEARQMTLREMEHLGDVTRRRLSENTQRAHVSERWAFGFVLSAAGLGLLVAAGLLWVFTRALRPLEDEKRSTEAHFRLLVEGVKDYALYLLDTEGRVASWNPGAERIQGWRAGEIIGRPGALLYPPEARGEQQLERELEQARSEGRLASEGTRLRKDGTCFWAETLLTPLRRPNGGLEGYAVLTRDITERNRLESAQRLFAEAERLFLSTTDPDETVAGLPRLLVPELADGCVLYFGASPADVHPVAVAHKVPEREAILWELVRRSPFSAETEAGICKVLRTGEPELFTDVPGELLERMATEAEHLSLLRRLKVCSALTVPLRIRGVTQGALMLLCGRPERRFTLTDQVFIEELAARAALALDNARLLREAQGALSLIGEAAHDLGNPLHTLQLTLGKLRRHPPADPDKLRDTLTQSLHQTQRLGRLLHNLLDLSRLGAGRLELEVGEVDLGELAREGLARQAELAEEVGSPLQLEGEPDVVGRWDRLRLERVLTNLLSNAFKYGRGQPIQVRVERGDGVARLSVTDHGPGIAPEQQHAIFERFKKAPARGEKKEGFGLGLYIVQQLVEAHGGTIHVQSTPGQGATFTVELPLETARREVDAPPEPRDLLH